MAFSEKIKTHFILAKPSFEQLIIQKHKILNFVQNKGHKINQCFVLYIIRKIKTRTESN